MIVDDDTSAAAAAAATNSAQKKKKLCAHLYRLRESTVVGLLDLVDAFSPTTSARNTDLTGRKLPGEDDYRVSMHSNRRGKNWWSAEFGL
jgi:hypothetical protein